MPSPTASEHLHTSYPSNPQNSPTLPSSPHHPLPGHLLYPGAPALLHQRIHILKELGSEYLIRLTSSTEVGNRLQVSFECVSESFQASIGNSSHDMMESMRRQLTALAQRLAANSIKHKLQLQNIGLSPQKDLKYFLGLDFQVDSKLSRQALYEGYLRDIDEILLEKINLDFQREIRRTTQRNGSPDYLVESQATDPMMEERSKSLEKGQADKERGMFGAVTKKPQSLRELKSTEQAYSYKLQNMLPSYYQESTSEVRILKVQELGTRIKKLKQCMKEILGRTPPKHAGLAHTLVRIDSSDPRSLFMHQDKFYISPNYTKYQKKIAEFRENQLVRASRQREALHQKNNTWFQAKSTHLIQQTSSKLLPKKDDRANNKNLSITNRLSHQVSKNCEPPFVQEPTSPIIQNRRQNCCLSMATEQDERKVREYWAFAQKDKYCQQFMYFLQGDRQESNCQEPKPKIFSASQSRAHSTTNSSKSIGSNACCAGSIQKQKAEEYVSTECSERGASELQAKIQTVIRNSMKIIKRLKVKECGQTH